MAKFELLSSRLSKTRLSLCSLWSEIDRESINRYMASLNDREYSPATVSRKIASLRSFFGFLTDEKLINNDPSEGIHPPKRRRVLPTTLSVEDMEALLDKSQEKNTPEDFMLMKPRD